MAEQIVNPASAAQLKPRNSEPTHLSGTSWDDLGGRSWDGPAGPEGYKIDASKGVKGTDTSIPRSVPAETSHLSGAKNEDSDVEIEFGDDPKHEAADVDDLDKALDETEDVPATKVDVKAEAEDDDDVNEEDDDDEKVNEEDDDDETVKEDEDESIATKKTVAESRRFRRALRMWEEAEAEDEKNEAEDDEDMKEEEEPTAVTPYFKKNEAEDDEKDVNEAEDDEKDMKEEDDDKPEFLKKEEAEDDEKNEAEEDEKAIKESLKIRIKMPSTAIFESVGFNGKQQKQMSAIFESAVKQTTKQVSKQIHEHYRKVAAATTRRNQRVLENRLNTYLSVVVEEWMKTNKVAVRQSLRADLSENFLNGLQRLFKEHYIDVPTSKVNVVEALTREVESLKQQVNEQHTQKLKLRRLAEAANKKRIVAEFARNLSEAKAAKLAKLAEDTEYVNAKDFREKLAMLKESYFDKRPSSMTRLPEEDVQVLKENAQFGKSEVDSVADAISRQVKSDW